MPNPIDKLRRAATRDKTLLPNNELKTTAAPADAGEEDLPDGASPLPCDCGPMPLPGRDQVEEPAAPEVDDGE